jgi:hypothetical protein
LNPAGFFYLSVGAVRDGWNPAIEATDFALQLMLEQMHFPHPLQ